MLGPGCARGQCMTYQLPFDSRDDPRWKLLDATRARLLAARSLDEIIAIVRASARGVVSADGVTFVLRASTATAIMSRKTPSRRCGRGRSSR